MLELGWTGIKEDLDMNTILDDGKVKIDEVNGVIRIGPSLGAPVIELGIDTMIEHLALAQMPENDHANRVNVDGYAVLTFSNDGGANYTMMVIVTGRPREPICVSTFTGKKLKEICNDLARIKGKKEAA